jgi:hypothetical protein
MDTMGHKRVRLSSSDKLRIWNQYVATGKRMTYEELRQWASRAWEAPWQLGVTTEERTLDLWFVTKEDVRYGQRLQRFRCQGS